MKKNKGFTLVELLIVIAIIGILSTAVLSSLNTSRVRAYDSKVKQQLAGLRSAAEIYYNNQIPNGYYNAGTLNSCTTGTNTVFNDVTNDDNGRPGLYLIFTGFPTPITLECNANALTYAVQANLIGGGYWCVDSRGVSRTETATLGSATQCP